MVGSKRKTKSKIQREGRYGKFKSRSKKLKYVKTPGGRTVVHYKNKKISKARCAGCGKQLAGTLRASAAKMKNLPKTKKMPERPYGGNLCSSCMRKKIISEARK
ncbi:50S ribosomal protein L34e, partial [Candidatus Woesearchaeota archaeon]|nr:50S ribosomal protein L34e [Candidatus Woesearchaeota archaeon]